MKKTQVSDDEFMSRLTGTSESKSGSASTPSSASKIVMRQPPSGPNKSLDEVLRPANSQSESQSQDSVSPSAATVQSEESVDVAERLLRADLIHANPYGPRSDDSYTAEVLEAMYLSLQERGQADAIHVIPHPDRPGHFMISDGWTRTLACQTHNKDFQLRARVHFEMDPVEAGAYGYRQNEERKAHTDYDRAQWVKKLLDGEMSKERIQAIGKFSPTMMTYLLAFHRLPDEVLAVVRGNKEKFAATVVYYLNRLYEQRGMKQTVKLAMEFSEERRTRSWLVGEVGNLLTPRSTVPNKPAATHIRYANGYLKEQEGRFSLSLQPDPDLREKFAEELEELVSRFAKMDTPSPSAED